MNISDFSNLSFFKADKYKYFKSHICDFSNVPRPHFCMGLILEGAATFSQDGEEDITVNTGEIIFVPITSRYVSEWHGSPNITYVSIHFAFMPSCGISEKDNFRLQKIIPDDLQKMIEDYLYILDNYNSDILSIRCDILSRFYRIMSEIIPLLSQSEAREHDERIDKAAEFMEMHSEKTAL